MSNEIVEYTENDIKKYICPNATDQEFFTFCQIVKARNLNPFLKEVHFVKYGNSPGQIVVGKDAIIKRAKKVQGYKGFKAGWFNDKGERLDFPIGEIMGAWCEVYAEGKEPLFISVLSNEYSSNQSTWKAKPATMIRKVAVVQAHREFSPEETGGLYDADEMAEPEKRPDPKQTESAAMIEDLKPKAEQKDGPAGTIQDAEPEASLWALKLSKLVDSPDYKPAIQFLLKSEEFAPEDMRTDVEENAVIVYEAIIKQKKEMETKEPAAPTPEDIESFFNEA